MAESAFEAFDKDSVSDGEKKAAGCFSLFAAFFVLVILKLLIGVTDGC